MIPQREVIAFFNAELERSRLLVKSEFEQPLTEKELKGDVGRIIPDMLIKDEFLDRVSKLFTRVRFLLRHQARFGIAEIFLVEENDQTTGINNVEFRVTFTPEELKRRANALAKAVADKVDKEDAQ